MKRPTIFAVALNVAWIVAGYCVSCIAGWISYALDYGLAIDDEARVATDMPPWFLPAAAATVVVTIAVSALFA